MNASDLHVVSAYFNPVRWASRLRLYQDFEAAILASGARLTVVECALGERPFELAGRPGINHVGVRAKTLVWNKECLLNIGIARILSGYDPGAKYFAWIDADVFFRRQSWAEDTVHALQQYDWIQPWSDAYDLGPKDEHLAHYKSFCRLWWEDRPVVPQGPNWWTFDGGPYDYAHTGYAWAATRQAIDWVGGLFEIGAMGAADHHMGLALVGAANQSFPGRAHPSYIKHVLQWQQRALVHLNRNIGFTWGTLEHRWHGRKYDRKYIQRWDMMVDQAYDPDADIKKNAFGVIELAGNKPRLTHLLDRYFRQRNEDVNSID